MLVLGAVLLGVAVGSGAGSGAEGRLLAGLTAVGCLLVGARDLLLRPVLVVRPSGLGLRRGLALRHVPWDEVERVRLVTDRRAPLLEVDLEDGVVLLSRGRLGVHPAEALDALRAAAPARLR